MFSAVFWGDVLRLCQALVQAAPTILVGLIVAAVFRHLIGYEGTRKLFGHGTRRELLQAWLVGMLLPVCSLGVIPVVIEMKKASLRGGTILAFALSAPLFNPLSLLYGLTLSEPFVILSFAFCSLIVVTLVGAIWDRIFADTSRPEEEPARVDYGIKRMAALGLFVSRESIGKTMRYTLVGLSGVILLATVLPPGSLQRSVNGDNPLAPLVMTGIAIPAYATPMLAMSQLGMMFQHGNSVGAAFALLALGAGMNFGLMLWMWMQYGTKKSLVWFALLLAVVLGLSYGIDQPLAPRGVDPADHTHAFDIYCRPFHAGTAHLPTATIKKLSDDIQIHEFASVCALAGCIAIGLGLNWFDPQRKIERRLAEPSPQKKLRYDIVIPGPVLGGAFLLLIVGLSLAGCYAYYPPPQESLDQMVTLRGDALAAAMSGNREEAMHWIPVWEDWTRKLEVGAYLRHGKISEYHRLKATIIRQKLELLEHAVAQNETDEVKVLCNSLSRSHRQLTVAYLEEL